MDRFAHVQDDALEHFATAGSPPLPRAAERGWITHDGAQIWYAGIGSGPAIVLLHGGFGNGENWSYQVPLLVAAGYRVLLIDSRGHGRSTRDARPLTYTLMASDVLAVMDALAIKTACLCGWSDGGTTALIVAMTAPERVAGVFFFASSMDLNGVLAMDAMPPIVERIFSRHVADYARLSSTPGEFAAFSAAVDHLMSTEPNYTANDLAGIRVPVAVVRSENDEFIKPEHARYIAHTIPGAELVELAGVSHFAPLQRPGPFNAALLAFVRRVLPVVT